MALTRRKSLFEPLAAWWAPHRCLLCGAQTEARDLCTGCDADLERMGEGCTLCGEALHGAKSLRCGRCLRHPPPFDATIAPYRYTPAIGSLILQLKFHGRLEHARLLSDLLGRALEEAPREAWPELIIPVPLHPKRLRERGYNQALELARPLAARFSIPLIGERCRRRRWTDPQTSLSEGDRAKNLRGAFELSAPLTVRHVAIVDDVVTTGATVRELAQTLRLAGASYIEVWAVARATKVEFSQGKGWSCRSAPGA